MPPSVIRQKGSVKGGTCADRPSAADASRMKGVTATPIAASSVLRSDGTRNVPPRAIATRT